MGAAVGQTATTHPPGRPASQLLCVGGEGGEPCVWGLLCPLGGDIFCLDNGE